MTRNHACPRGLIGEIVGGAWLLASHCVKLPADQPSDCRLFRWQFCGSTAVAIGHSFAQHRQRPRCGRAARTSVPMSDYLRTPTLSGSPALGGADDDWKAKALIFRSKRQEILASNIANADTPNYKARDISFEESLRRAMLAPESEPALATTASTHIGADFASPVQSTLAFARYIVPVQSNLDGNTVDMDLERSEFAQNAILYQLAITSLDDEYKEFKMASSDPGR